MNIKVKHSRLKCDIWYHSVTLQYIKYKLQVLFIINCSDALRLLANESTNIHLTLKIYINY